MLTRDYSTNNNTAQATHFDLVCTASMVDSCSRKSSNRFDTHHATVQHDHARQAVWHTRRRRRSEQQRQENEKNETSNFPREDGDFSLWLACSCFNERAVQVPCGHARTHDERCAPHRRNECMLEQQRNAIQPTNQPTNKQTNDERNGNGHVWSSSLLAHWLDFENQLSKYKHEWTWSSQGTSKW